MTRAFIDIVSFAREHRDDDPLRLLLQQQKYPDIDVRLVVQQLEGQRQALAKWPTLACCEGYFYPPRLNREQSSSEATARYKAGLFEALGGGTLADLTGGMGVDVYFMSRQARHTDYYEVDADLCAIAEYDFAVLGAENITCHCGDSLQQADFPFSDMVFIDPARRDSLGRKVSAFEDCKPDILTHLQMLRGCCRHLLVKASPMIDLQLAASQLERVEEVHVVALNGECKEVLFLLRGADTTEGASNPVIHCADIDGCGFKPRWEYSFTWEEEAASVPIFASEVEAYLYEPTASLMKGGCYNSICRWFDVKKLARNTHLYTSSRLIEDFPGRIFAVRQQIALNAKEIHRHIPEGMGHVVTRNFPLSAATLQRQLKLREGGHLFILAATLGSRPAGWLCERL